ncbi:MAG: hypothetical protein ACOYJJ_01365 [Anaerovoracaceae bacterium]|jgi:hypothetical protein
MLLTGKKRGEEIVEASIVLPAVILTILSMLLLMVYFYSCLTVQVKVHRSINDRADQGKGVFRIVRESETTESRMGGISTLLLKREYHARCYRIVEARVIRAGNMIGEEQ